eukprot:TRINITY_DN11851_c0_g1_i1.p1 TRINITY_DN11851_c0_g1~~TRINITY_DN11851_c0_g1_i1.p1  ORF type:complete len:331 (+),score=64.58 TRINITY_DN11851_c0_g1_i1:134-994(+)
MNDTVKESIVELHTMLRSSQSESAKLDQINKRIELSLKQFEKLVGKVFAEVRQLAKELKELQRDLLKDQTSLQSLLDNLRKNEDYGGFFVNLFPQFNSVKTSRANLNGRFERMVKDRMERILAGFPAKLSAAMSAMISSQDSSVSLISSRGVKGGRFQVAAKSEENTEIPSECSEFRLAFDGDVKYEQNLLRPGVWEVEYQVKQRDKDLSVTVFLGDSMISGCPLKLFEPVSAQHSFVGLSSAKGVKGKFDIVSRSKDNRETYSDFDEFRVVFQMTPEMSSLNTVW